ncbi:MAG: hypothetical protein ACYDH6_08420 [Acidimicrobiales bacterium]
MSPSVDDVEALDEAEAVPRFDDDPFEQPVAMSVITPTTDATTHRNIDNRAPATSRRLTI